MDLVIGWMFKVLREREVSRVIDVRDGDVKGFLVDFI